MIQVERTTALKALMTEKFKYRVYIHDEESMCSLSYDERTNEMPFKKSGVPNWKIPLFWGYYIQTDLDYTELKLQIDQLIKEKLPPDPNGIMPKEMGIASILVNNNKTFILYEKQATIFFDRFASDTPFQIYNSAGRKENLMGYWVDMQGWEPSIKNYKKLKNYIIKDELGTYKTLGTLNWVNNLNIIK